jgi:hypothetical protein
MHNFAPPDTLKAWRPVKESNVAPFPSIRTTLLLISIGCRRVLLVSFSLIAMAVGAFCSLKRASCIVPSNVEK